MAALFAEIRKKKNDKFRQKTELSAVIFRFTFRVKCDMLSLIIMEAGELL